MDTMHFNYFVDPGHGWVEADRLLLKLLGITDRISAYSYQNRDKVYLEEDCDADVLVEALKAKGITIKLDRIYQEVTPIRDYAGYEA